MDINIINNTVEEYNNYANKGWGQTVEVVTMKEIEELMKGKALAFFDGEYTHIITMCDAAEDIES